VTLPTGTYRELQRRWKALHGRDGLRVDEIACDSTGRALLVADLGDSRQPAVAIAAGVHGDEPAGPWALLELVETQALDERFAYRIWPCTNPTGFDAGIRANADGVDVNRTFGGEGGSPEARAILRANRQRTFALSLDLHEDCDAAGFYCYEYGGGEIGRAVIAALDARGFPIDPLEVTFGLAGPLDDAHCVREWGRIVADAFREAGLLGGLSYSLALARQGARSALTFETPSAVPWDQRLAMCRAAVLTAIATVA
jgi:murein peptide amidase A